MSETRQLCTFLVDGLFYGIDVVRVQEVIRYQEMTRVPLAPGDICGLINLRGQIVTAIDTRRRLGLSVKGPTDARPMNVVLRTDDGGASLLVDEIGDVIEVSSTAGEGVPETVSALARAVLKGVYKLDGRLLLELDAEKLFSGSAVAA